jgi:hypothetical protein
LLSRYARASERGSQGELKLLRRELVRESPTHLSPEQVFADDLATARALADHVRREKAMAEKANAAKPLVCSKCGREGFKNGWSLGAHRRHCGGSKAPMPRTPADPISPSEVDGKTPVERTADEKGMALAIQSLRNRASRLRDRARAIDLMADELSRP